MAVILLLLLTNPGCTVQSENSDQGAAEIRVQDSLEVTRPRTYSQADSEAWSDSDLAAYEQDNQLIMDWLGQELSDNFAVLATAGAKYSGDLSKDQSQELNGANYREYIWELTFRLDMNISALKMRVELLTETVREDLFIRETVETDAGQTETLKLVYSELIYLADYTGKEVPPPDSPNGYMSASYNRYYFKSVKMSDGRIGLQIQYPVKAITDDESIGSIDYNSQTTVQLSKQMAEAFGEEYQEYSLGSSFADAFFPTNLEILEGVPVAFSDTDGIQVTKLMDVNWLYQPFYMLQGHTTGQDINGDPVPMFPFYAPKSSLVPRADVPVVNQTEIEIIPTIPLTEVSFVLENKSVDGQSRDVLTVFSFDTNFLGIVYPIVSGMLFLPETNGMQYSGGSFTAQFGLFDYTDHSELWFYADFDE